MTRNPAFLPLMATVVGVGLFSAMDAVMKSGAIAIGAFSAYFLRSLIGFLMIAPFWWTRTRKWPSRSVMRIHLIRGVVVAFMGWTFFFALVRLPLAEAIALSFIAPLVALYLAAVLLGEKIQRKAIIAAILGLAGVLVIVGGKIGREHMTQEAGVGLVAMMLSALLYAWNLVLQRQQALVANPAEVSTFQNGIIALTLLAGTPFLLVMPETTRTWIDLLSGALLAVAAMLCLSWAYAREEAQVLVSVEYTGFLWAALFGWLFFGEHVSLTTVGGAVLIVIGCWIATRSPPEQTAV